MSDQHEHAGEEFADEERRLFEMLNRYVEFLHAGDADSCTHILTRQPEFEGLLSHLDTLENLAPPPPPPDPVKTAPDAETPQAFGKYDLLAEVGRGGMGVVYKARQTDLDRIVALKMILTSQLASPEEVRRFYAEAKAAGRLTHPNIVGIHEVGEIRGQHYFAMDHVEGQSLARLLRDGPMDAETAAECLSAVARAVEYLHAYNIVHRDLKPSNILIDEHGGPHVTDFGLAKVFQPDSERTRSGAIIGTPSYMAPEQAAGKTDDVSARSDIYSLGAILYEMLTGRPPFKSPNPLDTLVQALEGEPTLPRKLSSRIPRELELICLRCLEKDPRRRYESAAALADDLDRFLKREPVEARPSTVAQRMQRWGRREPALVSRLAGLLVAGGIVQVNYLVYLGQLDWDYHVWLMSMLCLWGVVAFVFQRLLHRDSIAYFARFAWAAADTTLLTVVLYSADGPLGPLLIGYPLLIAASGLFFRVRLVWFMTGVTLVSYAALMRLRPEEAQPPHYPIIFAAVLVVLGVVVAYQVYRVRVLSRYYQHRRLP